MDKVKRRYVIDLTLNVEIPNGESDEIVKEVLSKSKDIDYMFGVFKKILTNNFCEEDEIVNLTVEVKDVSGGEEK